MSKSQPSHPPAAEEGSSGLRILYMENDPGLAPLVQKRLEGAGYVVDFAHDGGKGLSMYATGNYDIVAINQSMPVHDGLEVIRILASLGPLPPTIVITGTGNETVAVEAIKLGAGDYIIKDAEGGYLDLLPAVIERLLQQQRLVKDREQAEEALRKSEKKYHNLFDHSLNGFALHEIILDTEGQPVDYVFLEVNRAFEELTGLSAAEVVGKRATHVLPDLESTPFIEICGRVVLTGEPVRFNHFSASLNRHYAIAAFSLQQGQFATAFEDITERVQAEEALKESEEKLRLIFENAFDGISIYEELLDSGTRRLLDCNERYAEMAGRSKEELLKIGNTSLVQKNLGPVRSREENWRIRQGRISYKGLISWVRPDDQDNIIEYSAAPIQVGDRALTIGIDRDITERVRAEEELKKYRDHLEELVAERTHELEEANARLKELDQLKSKFMANISHQLRTPVTNMKLYAHLLRKGIAEEKAELFFRIMEEQADRLVDLIQDILEMTTLDSGQAVTTWQPIAWPGVIENIVTLYQSQTKALGLSLVAKSVPPDLPTVKGDPTRLTQALEELVENAVIFTPPGGLVTVEARAAREEGQQWVTIAVRDTGPGIVPEDRKRIFDRFYRGSLAEAGHIPGTGLGLSMVQVIMDAHGGRVTVDSTVGEGSTFTLWLPSAADEA